jgi:uncharacterized protein (TIGR00375 family)
MIVDLHIHSHFSYATSKYLDADNIYKWGKIKGIEVIGTGDFTHPAWFAELKEKLEPAEPGLFKLKKEYQTTMNTQVPDSCKGEMRYLLTVEVSNIYAKNDKVRKVHNVICAPSFEAAEAMNTEFAKYGNLSADGRPILKLSSKNAFEVALATSPDCMFIPAHIWTPHFAVFGSKSGYDSLVECFEELTPQLTALETGLSSDPGMNWKLSQFDDFTFVSNSDAHSPQKLGREANRLDCEMTYYDIKDTIKKGDKRFVETLEFYPEEGKYHHDGHRDCNVNFSPIETEDHKGLCPKCGKPVTVGVLNRIDMLSDRIDGAERPSKKIPYRYLIPLAEVISDVLQVGISSKKVERTYLEMIEKLGDEFSILLDIPLNEIQKASTREITKAIENVRTGNVHIEPGYDGEFGKIQVFTPNERNDFIKKPQLSLF